MLSSDEEWTIVKGVESARSQAWSLDRNDPIDPAATQNHFADGDLLNRFGGAIGHRDSRLSDETRIGNWRTWWAKAAIAAITKWRGGNEVRTFVAIGLALDAATAQTGFGTGECA
jgi:hypothetical protein